MNKLKNNYILSALPSQVYQSLSDRFESVQLSLGEILIEANRKAESLYFPIKGVISLVSAMQDGLTTEVGLIGKEGMVGIPQFLGQGVSNNRSIVQVKGTAIKRGNYGKWLDNRDWGNW
ncbi:MAG: cyclic nucleotide-binding domain-containing protein [Xenococcaceae cyanobacterium]